MFSIFESYDFLSEKIPESKRIDYFSNRLRNILSNQAILKRTLFPSQ